MQLMKNTLLLAANIGKRPICDIREVHCVLHTYFTGFFMSAI